MQNDFEKNRRVYPEEYGGPVKTSAPIPLPPADKGTTGGKGPGQDGWESVDGVDEGPVQAVNDMANEGPIQRTKRYIAKAEAKRMVPRHWPDSGIAMPSTRAPVDFGAALARGLNAATKAASEVIQDVKSVIYPREVGENGVLRDKKIHQFGLNENIDEALERTSIDNENDDMNAWGGLPGYDHSEDDDGSQFAQAIIALGGGQYIEQEDTVDRDDIGSSVDTEDEKYDTIYPSEAEYRTEGFYSNLFTPQTKTFKWVLPGYLAAGPHPIFTSHLEDLTELKKAGIKAIVTLFDKPLDEKYLDGFQYLFVPTVEGFASDLKRVCKFIATQETLGNPVFIHSLHCKGRVGTALAAYFMHKKYLNGADEAMTYVKQNYGDKAIETVYQEDALLKFMLDE